MTTLRNNASNTRGRPFEKGNPGRPKGAKNKATVVAEELLDGEAEALTRKLIEKAKEGNMTALRLCLERICPPRKDRPIHVELPNVANAGDAVTAIGAILENVAYGEITPSEGQALASMIEVYRRVLETQELENRIKVLERVSARGDEIA